MNISRRVLNAKNLPEGYELLLVYDNNYTRNPEYFIYGLEEVIIFITRGNDSTEIWSYIEMPKKAFIEMTTHLENIFLRRDEVKGLSWGWKRKYGSDLIDLERVMLSNGLQMGYEVTNMSRVYRKDGPVHSYRMDDMFLKERGGLKLLIEAREAITNKRDQTTQENK